MQGAIRAELENDMLLQGVPVQRVYNLVNTVGLYDARNATKSFNNLEFLLEVRDETLILLFLRCFANDLNHFHATSFFHVRYLHPTAVDLVLPALIVEAGDFYVFRTKLIGFF